MGFRVEDKILIVDDDEIIRHLCSEILSSEGYEVRTARDGDEALDMLKDGGFGLVISDIMMPRLDGPSLYDKAVCLYPHLKNCFLFMTGNRSIAAGDMGAQAGECIFKPFRVSELLSRVRACLPGEKALSAEGEPSSMRREARFSLLADCGVLEDDANSQKIVIAKARDISAHGLKIRYRGAPLRPVRPVGIFIKLNYQNLLRDAIIIWSRPLDRDVSEAGLNFSDPLPESSISSGLGLLRTLRRV